MPSYLDVCIQSCRKRGVVLDTNIFILFLVGSWNYQLLEAGSIKRLKPYSLVDFQILLALLSPFSKRVVTSGIVAESCNLLDMDNRHHRGAIFHFLSQVLNDLTESQKSAKMLAASPAFIQFGLADASVADLANRGYLIVTDDLKLQNFLERSGFHSLNFTQLRTVNWLSSGHS